MNPNANTFAPAPTIEYPQTNGAPRPVPSAASPQRNVYDPTTRGRDNGGIRKVGLVQRTLGFVGRHLDGVQNATIGQVMEAVGAKAERVTAETTATVRGLTNIAIGGTLGLLEGLTGGTFAGLSGTDRLMITRMKTSEISPAVVGHVQARERRMGIDYITLALIYDLDGTPLPEGTVTPPLSAAIGAKHQVNIQGERFEAFFIPIKAGEGRLAKTVGFYIVDDRERGADAVWPVYQMMASDLKAAVQ
jgi:hypothetical protein